MDNPLIPDKVYFRIGEVCGVVGIKPSVLRYWETEFPEIAPSKTSGGVRLYRRADVETIIEIKRLLYDKGFTIAGAKNALYNLRKTTSEPIDKNISDRLIAGLKSVRDILSK